MDASIAPRSGSTGIVGRRISGREPGLALVWAAVVVGWLVALAAEATGNAAALHHHALIEGGPPLWLGALAFLLAWQVMIVAMMLPASMPAARAVALGTEASRRGRFAVPAFLGAYLLVWTAFGLLAFGGDVVVHRIVDGAPLLAARPWLVEAALLLVAGSYQFAPSKRRGLAACRHPQEQAGSVDLRRRGALGLGLAHGLACVRSSWALMLVMFGAGFANLTWMAVLTALMVYEARGAEGLRVASMAGFMLLGLAALVIASESAVL